MQDEDTLIGDAGARGVRSPVQSLGTATLIAQAFTLALLWLGEALAPMFERSDRRAALSARLRNGALGALNGIVAALFAALTLGVTLWGAEQGFGLMRALRAWTGGEGLAEAGLFVLSLLLLDLWHYAFHVAAHKTPILWRFHAVHHHDPVMQATTAMRFHVVEIAAQCAVSLPVYLLLGVDLIHILAYQLVLLPTALFHHANVNIPERFDRWLRWLIVTPRMHVVHHSAWQPETDSNYAAVLSVWDRVFGTYRRRPRPESIEVGLEGFREEEVTTLRGMLTTPMSDSRAGPGRPPRNNADTRAGAGRLLVGRAVRSSHDS